MVHLQVLPGMLGGILLSGDDTVQRSEDEKELFRSAQPGGQLTSITRQ